ncbi:hypothetical protein JZO70_00635 [Enterococcus sp. 669A]|uniref:Uncharacterized protein n=1 Tax=Candidatus Enterococcus moelleringii TaxID=2815325 RepID=A0ABS3L4V5_9ENTE|nr:hypothetical protein [Enterococcus sp. 669A]MBO1304648.1 hypothetical protein [Enterococcus sp. 669A]
MIQKEILEAMTQEQLDAEFNRDVEVMMKQYDSDYIIYITTGISPTQVMDNLFNEMKQIWLKRLSLELKGGE